MSAEHAGLMISRMEGGKSTVLGQRCSIQDSGMAISRSHNYLPAFQVNFRIKKL